MQTQPSVIVRKSSFLAATASGIFGTLMTLIVCGTGLGGYAIHIADKRFGQAFEQLSSDPQKWRDALPAALSESLDDRREPGYRDALKITTRLVESPDREGPAAFVEVRNNGPETVTLLSLHGTVESADGVPAYEFNASAATPFAFAGCRSNCGTAGAGDWRGPLLPGATRKLLIRVDAPSGAAVACEVADVRVWNRKAVSN